MSYNFTGLLSNDTATLLPEDGDEAKFRSINHQNLKVGVFFPTMEIDFNGSDSKTNQAVKNLSRYGITSGVLIDYSTWAGAIDSVRAVKVSNSKILKNTYKECEEISYQELSNFFETFEIILKDPTNFEPFSRGFWGE